MFASLCLLTDVQRPMEGRTRGAMFPVLVGKKEESALKVRCAILVVMCCCLSCLWLESTSMLGRGCLYASRGWIGRRKRSFRY